MGTQKGIEDFFKEKRTTKKSNESRQNFRKNCLTGHFGWGSLNLYIGFTELTIVPRAISLIGIVLELINVRIKNLKGTGEISYSIP
jgi:hypothetical protein